MICWLFLVFAAFLVFTIHGQDVYYQMYQVERSGTRQNNVIIHCRLIQNQVPQTNINPAWYFNGSLYDEHHCTTDAYKADNTLTFAVIPACEGYVQCGDGLNVLSSPTLLLGELLVHCICKVVDLRLDTRICLFICLLLYYFLFCFLLSWTLVNYLFSNFKDKKVSNKFHSHCHLLTAIVAYPSPTNGQC